MEDENSVLTRRNLLRIGWVSIIASGLLSLWPLSQYLTSSEDSLQSDIITLKISPLIGNQWYHIENTRVWLKRAGQGYAAILATCTHLGCEVAYNSSQQKWFCPCHGSVYNAEGTPIAGPAPRDLARVAVKAVNDTLIVNIGKVVGMDRQIL
ncbi:MAG: ubiquinol-cytochrome c reductase iron-sulfur subunit [Peptococcaceae bacterium]|nr:ubiquinol-cytochrome c reductase iron-sulfur subunit [Peptococcaceae bacterium]